MHNLQVVYFAAHLNLNMFQMKVSSDKHVFTQYYFSFLSRWRCFLWIRFLSQQGLFLWSECTDCWADIDDDKEKTTTPWSSC